MIDWEAAIKLRSLLFEFEEAVGIADASEVEKDILLYFHELAAKNPDKPIEITAVREMPALKKVPPATLTRAIKKLIEKEKIALHEGRQRGLYSLTGK